MSSLHDFLQGKEPEPESRGEPIDITVMCECGQNLDMHSRDRFKTAESECPVCGKTTTIKVPAWLGDLLR